MERSTAFIMGASGADHLWRDFETGAGASSEWASGFVLHALEVGGGSLRLDPHIAALRRRQRSSGGWGYNRRVPPDADSTAWALLALLRRNHPPLAIIDAGSGYLRRHHLPPLGGVATYAPEDAIHRFIAMNEAATRGWLNAHICVTAVALQALLISDGANSSVAAALVRYLRKERGPDALWRSYWWRGSSYASFQTLRALSWADALSASELDDSIRAVLARQDDAGGWSPDRTASPTAFETAFGLLGLSLKVTQETLIAAERAITWLLSRQEPDGGWTSLPMLCIPSPGTKRPVRRSGWRDADHGTNVMIADRGRLFTTASVHWALGIFRLLLS